MVKITFQFSYAVKLVTKYFYLGSRKTLPAAFPALLWKKVPISVGETHSKWLIWHRKYVQYATLPTSNKQLRTKTNSNYTMSWVTKISFSRTITMVSFGELVCILSKNHLQLHMQLIGIRFPGHARLCLRCPKQQNYCYKKKTSK